MNIKTKLQTATALAVACSALLGCSRQTPQTSSENPRDLSNSAQQKLAQAYFRLGVATSCNVILKHQIAGDQIPEPKALLKECIEQDIADSNGTTLLKAP